MAKLFTEEELEELRKADEELDEDSTADAFKALGFNSKDLMATFAAGGDEASATFKEVVTALVEVEDQVKRDEMGVALFGTQWEDLGVDAVAALADITDSAYDTENALGKINNVKYNDLKSAWEGIKRKAEVSLLPASQAVTDAFISLAPKIESAISAVSPYITSLAEQLGPLVEKAIELGEQGFGFVADVVAEAAPIVMDFVQNGIIFLKDNIDILIPVVAGLTAAFVAYKTAMAISGIISAVTTALNGMSIAQGALNAVMAMNPIGLIVTAIGLLIAAAVALIMNWDDVKAAAKKLGKYLEKIWKAIKDKAVKTFKQIVTFISKAWDSIKTTTTKVWKAIEKGMSVTWDAIKTIFADALDALKKGLSKAWDSIKETVSTVWNGIKTTLSDIWEGIKTVFSNALDALKTGLSNAWDSIKETVSTVWNGIKTTLSDIWEGIKTVFSNALEKVKTTISDAWTSVKTTTSDIWEGIKTTISDIWESIKTKVGEFVTSVKTTVSDAFSSLLETMCAPFNTVLGVIEEVAGKIGGVLSKIGEVITGANSINIPGYATGGFTNGISIAGEDPRYPTEAVISFNPAYRAQNLAYWAQAGRMLGVSADDFSISTAGGAGGYAVLDLSGMTFAPVINVSGSRDNQDIIRKLEEAEHDFVDFLVDAISNRTRGSYGEWNILHGNN